MTQQQELATFGAGCFWCVEAIFQDMRGVEKVVSGYMGGAVANPSYEAVCTGTTGHAEVIQVTFDPSVVSYETLLEVFWRTHDPTTLNRQGADVGTQYRSAVFYHSDAQRQTAEASRTKTEADKLWPNPIVTEITAATEFYTAENYHQNYFNQNGYQPYCMMVINPKVQKFRKAYAGLLKR
ncbi:MAG: peptide-methionine (S)-S-oxide reductase MsrA [Chloroflexi bacterium]|nr:peptide-methionine (S)-S-oxide reductase MsrA [Chloroflexota bacterium]